MLSQRVAEAKEKHGADSLQAWCATARLMTLLDETKRAAAALPLAREFMAVAERRLGSEHSVTTPNPNPNPHPKPKSLSANPNPSPAQVTLEATAYIGVLCDDVGAIDEAMALTQQVYDALLRLVRNGDEELRRSNLLKGHMSLSDCGEQLAHMLRRKGRHSEAADILKRLLMDLEPLPEDNFNHHIHLKQQLSLELVRCVFRTLRTSCFPLIPRPHRSQESAGNLEEAAWVMAPLVTQMDEGTTPLVRAFAIFTLSKLRASTLIRLRAPCALKSCWRCSAAGPCIFLLQNPKAVTAVSQDSGAFCSPSRAPQLCCCCATGSLAAGWRLEGRGSLRNFASFTQSSHVLSRNSSSSRATTATLPAGRS